MLTYLDTLIGFSVLMLAASLLIMVLNQIVSALFAHRGSNLRWGLEVLFRQLNSASTVYPLLAQQARTVAETILTHPLVSDSVFSTKWTRLIRKRPRLLALVKSWQLASGVRADELAVVLKQIVDVRPAGIPKGLHAALRHELDRLLKSPSSAALRDATLATSTGVPAPAVSVQVAGNQPAANGNLEDFYGQIMDRVRQRFTMWMRIWTVAFAFLAAGFFCVDSITVLGAIFRNSALRAQLVNAAPQTTASALGLMPGTTQLFTDALNNAARTIVPPLPSAAGINSEGDAADWIKKNIPDAASQTKVTQAFDTNWRADVEKRAASAGKILSTLSTNGLPKFGPSAWKRPRSNPLQVARQFAGVLITGLLLSLGAPFWFNTLSSLTSLRPLLAGPSSSQQQQKST